MHHSFQPLHQVRIPRGYSALITILLLSSLLTVLVFGSSSRTLLARASQVAYEHALSAEEDAKSCEYEALVMYAENPAQTQHDQRVILSTGTSCFIDLIAPSGMSVIIRTHAIKGFSYHSLQVAVPFPNTSF